MCAWKFKLATLFSYIFRIGDDRLMEQEETVPSSSGLERSIQKRQRTRKASHKSPTPPVSSPTTTAVTETAEIMPLEVPVKRSRLDPSPDSPSDTVAHALMRSVEILQRLTERKPVFDRPVGPRDADECFADFVCMSLKSIDNSSRVHARIAILHALAQFQT